MTDLDSASVSRVDRKWLWHVVAVVSALIAIIVGIAILTATWPHLRIRLRAGGLSREDAFTLLFPVTIPVSALIASVLMTVVTPKSWLLSGVLAGFFAGSVLFLVLPVFALVTQYELITNDGTAYWGLLFLPSVWVGLPLVLGGGFLGAVVNAIGRRNGTDKRG